MKKAFTMLELVMVIVVIGILAAVAIPRTGRDNVAEAATQLISHIRYAQHLALVDDKFDSTVANWYENIWQIRFTGNTYSIVSNDNTNFAQDAMNNGTNMQDIDLNDDYGVTIAFSGSCGANTIIGFDHVGRPILGDLSGTGSAYVAGNLMVANCVIGVSDGTTDINITIRPETGYASIQ
ncbi:type II secretion system protein [Candidatus Sulfurimonas marisnigri]|uniref:Type II secretion system protein n=1 Tax=Candidatus Sulfurimonas marisnigri TaxID=2740405 RepID=A0A7S7LYY7_9BACT|nr:type II secretion system protein [Candidatus Sulfurimonas marisnigri]QOY54016.1 type II secretion system protein [Candidatus Sulfurimonas marisnigri]